MNLTESIAPRSDQLNAEDLLSGPRTVTVEKVDKGSAEQPVNIHLVEFPGRPFRPSKTVRRILVAAWGAEASDYAGRRMTIYRDPAVIFAGQEVGGIRVSHLSHIDKPIKLALTVTRGKRAPYKVEPLREAEPARSKEPDYKALEEWAAETENLDGLRSTIERLAPLTTERAESTRAIVQARIDHLTAENTDTTTQED